MSHVSSNSPLVAPTPFRQIDPWLGRLGVIGISVVVVVVGFWGYEKLYPHTFNESFVEHAHCIVSAGFSLQAYAEEHHGKFPVHPDGYPQALMLLPEDSPWYALTGPGYQGEVLAEAKRTGRKLSEAECGRVYIQGLSLQDDGRIVILFDKLFTPGGDHAHFMDRFTLPYSREATCVRGDRRLISREEWPEFAREQIDLLVAAGISRAEAERLYAQ